MSDRGAFDDDGISAQAADWIVRLNDATATEADFIEWQAWLGERPEHAQAFHELQEAWRRSAVLAQASPDRLRPLRGGEGAASAAELRPLRRSALLRWAAAAALAAVTTGVAMFAWHGNSNTIRTATAEMRSLRLPDGSRAALGPETHLQIVFSEQRRSVRMTGGEAYFEVARDAQRPFSVDTPAGQVRALGTAFSVNLSGKRMAVVVTDGSVQIEPQLTTSDTAPQGELTPVTIGAGQRFVKDGAVAKADRPASAASAVSWREGRLQYEGEPLRVVVADINRYSPTKLRIADADTGELRYTGTVFPDSLDVWLSSIEGVFPLHVQEKGGERVIVGSSTR